MEKTEITIQTIEKHTHYFYCDSCNKYLGKAEEYEDGWYATLGKFELKFYVSNKWYRLNKCFCDECKNNFIDNMKSILQNIGFEED